MFVVLVFGRVMRCSYDSACAMSMAAILILAENPGYLFHAGFQLSFAAACAASLVSPMLNRYVSSAFCREKKAEEKKDGEKEGKTETRAGKMVQTLLRAMKENTILWSAVQLCTLPLTAYYFYEIPAWSLLLNLLLVPCVQYVLGAGVVGSLICLIIPRAGKWLLLPADLGLGLFDKILNLSRFLPRSSVVCGRPVLQQMAVYYTALGVILWILFRADKKTGGEDSKRKQIPYLRRRMGYCAVILAVSCIILFFRHRPVFTLTMLDVGQGDCIVLQTGHSVFLSDGGSTTVKNVGRYRILPYLESQALGYVEAVCISHNDADHMNGIEEILIMTAEKQTALRIGWVYMPLWMMQTEDGRRIAAEARAAGAIVRSLQRGNTMVSGDLCIEVLHPFLQNNTGMKSGSIGRESLTEHSEVQIKDGIPAGGAQSGNAGSVVLQVTFAGFSALLTGDLEKEGEEELLPYLSDIDCLKVGHHGSRWSTSQEFLEVTCPEIALVSAPAKSMYGHPHQETLDRLEEAGAAIFAAKDCGAVEIRVQRSGTAQISAYLGMEDS